MAQKSSEIGALRISVDTSELDAALEKAERLKRLLEEVKALQSGIRLSVNIVGSKDSAAEITKSISKQLPELIASINRNPRRRT